MDRAQIAAQKLVVLPTPDVFVESSCLADPSPRVLYQLSTYKIRKFSYPGSHCSVALYAFNDEQSLQGTEEDHAQGIMQELRYVGHDAKQSLL
jgi:hypothetical protein